MARKKKTKTVVSGENIRLPKSVVDRLRTHKQKTFLPITKIAELAISKYLDENERETRKGDH
jgi:phosphoribosylamine-glycine ligase